MTIVICTDDPMDVGRVYVNREMTDAKRDYHNVSVRVIAPATRDEYLACIAEHGYTPSDVHDTEYYYRVQMDCWGSGARVRASGGRDEG